MTSNLRILVSGAGIAGNAVAWLLARSGAHVVVLERANKMLAQGQNVDLQGAAITAVKKMALLDEVKRLNTTEKGTVFINASGKPFATFPTGEGRASPTNEFEILRGDLAQILYDRARTESAIEYRFGTTITKVIENSEDLVTVELSDGSVESYDLAIAADGQWSKLRKFCFPAEDIIVVDKDAYCTYFTADRQEDDTNWWQVYHALRSRVITVRPDPHGTVRFAATMMPCNDKERQQWKDAMRRDRKAQEAIIQETFAGAGWQVDRFLDSMTTSPDFYCHGLQQIKMKSWSTGRVVCIGDAGWAPTPLTGQGTTLAIIGAYLLAGELDKLHPGESPMVACKAFDELFHGHVDKVQNLPSFIPGVAHPETAFQRWLLRNLLFVTSYVLAFPPIRDRLGVSDPEKNDDGFKLPSYRALDAKLASS